MDVALGIALDYFNLIPWHIIGIFVCVLIALDAYSSIEREKKETQLKSELEKLKDFQRKLDEYSPDEWHNLNYRVERICQILNNRKIPSPSLNVFTKSTRRNKSVTETDQHKLWKDFMFDITGYYETKDFDKAKEVLDTLLINS